MFRAIARLLFGVEEQTPDDFKPGEMAEEEWQVVSHQEAGMTEASTVGPQQPAMEQASSARHQDTAANTEASESISVADADAAGRGVAAHLGPLVTADQLTLVQKARAWADRRHAARNAVQRHNRVRRGVHHGLFHLQQPGRRGLAR